jgi:hypothetical protein
MLRNTVHPAYSWVRLDIYNGVRHWIAYTRLDYANQTVQIWTGASAWADVGSVISTYGSTVPFHLLKIVGDISTGNYVRLLYDNVEYDLSAVAMHTNLSAEAPSLTGSLGVSSPEGTNSIVEYDDVIITANEV